jgi:hypothetical protein
VAAGGGVGVGEPGHHSVQPSPRPADRGWVRHVPFGCVLVIGIALRWLDWRAYRPGLLFYDSRHYLSDALTWELNTRRPSGYSFVFSPLIRTGDISLVTLAQHLLVLAIAVLLYAFLLRRRVPPWGGALASVPLLCDPLQLVLEQYFLSDVLFQALMVVACVLLLWRRQPLLIDVVAAGALLGYAQLVRGAGAGMVVPAVLALVALRVGWRKVVALVVAFVIPLLIYMAAFHQQEGVWGTSSFSSRYLYGRVTTFVHCHGLQLPGYERPLCPKKSVERRRSSNWYIWGNGAPRMVLDVPPGLTETQVLEDFNKRVIRAQPVAFARIVTRDFLLGFHPSRTHKVPGFPPRRWLFHGHYWSLDEEPGLSTVFAEMGFWPPEVNRDYAAFLTRYQQVFHTPGPSLFLAALLGSAASAGVGRARRSGDRVAAGLLVGVCLTSLLTTAALSGFGWRYQLPQLALLGPAGALGLTALLRRPRYGLPDAQSATLRRLTALSLRRPASDDAVRAAEPQVGVAVAVIAGAGVGVAAVLSGWAKTDTAAVLAVLTSLTTVVLLFTSRWRGLPTAQPIEQPPMFPTCPRRPRR